MVERIEIGTNTAALERTQILVIEAQASAVLTFEATLISALMPNPTTATTSQEIPTTPSTTKTLLLFTTDPRFNRRATEASSESTKSSTRHIEKLPSEEPSTINVLPNATEVHIDLILANQQTIMVNQHALQANQHALERRMDKMESLMLQMLKALQKGNPKGNQ